MQYLKYIVSSLLLLVLMTACGDDSKDDGELADPGVAPPAVIAENDRELRVIGSSFVDQADPSLVHINITAIKDPATGLAYSDLSAANFKVMENSVVQGFLLKKISSSDIKAKMDIVFIIDTTISMGEEISSLKTNLIPFLNDLKNKNMDIMVAGYAYADETVEYKGLTANYEDPSAFHTWITGLSNGYMGQNGGDWPENGLDPIGEAMDGLSWRVGAQKVFILITDDSFHIQTGSDPFTDWTVDSLYNDKLKGKAIVHAIGKERTRQTLGTTYYNKDHERYLTQLTGGNWHLLPADGNLDLSSTVIASNLNKGYLLTYKTDNSGGSHQVRVVVTVDANDGEYTETVTY